MDVNERSTCQLGVIVTVSYSTTDTLFHSKYSHEIGLLFMNNFVYTARFLEQLCFRLKDLKDDFAVSAWKKTRSEKMEHWNNKA